MKKETETEIILISNLVPADVFCKEEGAVPLIEKIKERARAFVPDVSTEKGRKEIASLAYQISRSKTALDDMGKELVEGWKSAAKGVDIERKRIRDELDALRDEVRSPLTELENREKEHEAALITLSTLSRLEGGETLEQIKDLMSGEEKYFAGREWELFTARATFQHEKNVQTLQDAYDRRKQYDEDQAELERLRKEQEVLERKRREEQIAAQAKKEAEEKAALAAKIEAERVAKEKAEAEEKSRLALEYEKAEARRQAMLAEQARLDVERQKLEAEARAKKAEEDRIAAEKKAESDRIEAEEKTKRDVEAAAKAERDRIAAEKQAEADATAKREADKAHRAKINNEILASLSEYCGEDDEIAKAIIAAIVRGLIPNVKIIY